MNYSELVRNSLKLIEDTKKEAQSYEDIARIASSKLSSAVTAFIRNWPRNRECPVSLYGRNIVKILDSKLEFNICWAKGIGDDAYKPTVRYSWEDSDGNKVEGVLAEYFWEESKWRIANYPDGSIFSDWPETDESSIPSLLSDFVEEATKKYLRAYPLKIELKNV